MVRASGALRNDIPEPVLLLRKCHIVRQALALSSAGGVDLRGSPAQQCQLCGRVSLEGAPGVWATQCPLCLMHWHTRCQAHNALPDESIPKQVGLESLGPLADLKDSQDLCLWCQALF
eukprot:13438596-Alexandrium_andersonii.AAC.1